MLPTIFSIGSIPIASYGLCLALGFIGATFIIWKYCRDAGITEEYIFDNVLVVTIMAFIGARLFFMLTHWPLFTSNLLRGLVLWRFPGFSFWGGLLFGLSSLYFYTRYQKLSLPILADSYGKSYPVALFFGSLAVFLDGTVSGKPTNWFIGMQTIGSVAKVHPVGLYGVALAVAGAVCIIIVVRKFSRGDIPKGVFAWGMLSFIGLTQLLLAFARRDLLYWQGFCLDYIIATILFIMPLVPLFRLLNGREWLTSTQTKVVNLLSKKNHA